MTLSKKTQKTMRELDEKMTAENRLGDFRRARSFTVGTAFGGVTEINMRGNDGNVTWATFQPVEVVELLHQLAANIGCHLHLTPRRDFASWRDWKYTEAELEHYRGGFPHMGVGWPPHVNDMAPHMDKGMVLPPPEQQPGFRQGIEDGSNAETVAIEKVVKRKRAKRSTATA